MNDAASKAIAVQKAIDDVIRRDRGRLMAGLIARLGDFQTAEDALQEASISALSHWGRAGIPSSPAAWLMKVGFNSGVSQIRSKAREAKKAMELEKVVEDHVRIGIPDDFPDERLRLIFTCCHPILEEKSRIALTLRTVCGLTTKEIARAFLDTEVAMGQRLSRAKAKIRSKGIEFSVPEPEQWSDRLGTALSTLYLIFTTGYVSEDTGPRDLCREALFLVRLLEKLRPEQPEIEGALALMLFAEARQPARIAPDGASAPIAEQNRELWRKDLITEGRDILVRAMMRRRPGPFQIKAAIADCHMSDPMPDWPQMSLLYEKLWRLEPTPVVTLNWAVVLAELQHTELALQKLTELQSALSDFQPWHAARASMLEKLHQFPEAAAAYRIAIYKAPNAASRVFLQNKLRRIENLGQPDDSANDLA
ncbi:MAG: sigma factor-like helix-turn-helix DNA-binding protein [Alphaproteobacteria bacterium]|nr:sigma factor-like helix-turn-helix DNA-binding protein [Alphaproteobacteria bacterium]